ncbi:Stress up-regulated Nod 19 [Dillenia turbinata]|uniref:Stress up-regulated Nod 19 n=1 Tax=Dillenia turbinata TaxID=194707 RepID=A0AAN8V046_9MAGN
MTRAPFSPSQSAEHTAGPIQSASQANSIQSGISASPPTLRSPPPRKNVAPFLLRAQLREALVDENTMKSAVFLSPEFVVGPGSVVDKYYYDIDFPRGHIALKSLNAEVVDEAGNPVSLQETYLHHWVVVRYYERRAENIAQLDLDLSQNQSDIIPDRNSGLCDDILGQYFGLGSETRRTATHVPYPYGIEVGNPLDIPDGYEEKWFLNVHAIDTRGVEDKLECAECKCDLYNVTEDAHGRPIQSGYEGGLLCCYDKMQCRVKEGFEGPTRRLYMKYTVHWVDWDDRIIPVKIYIFDVTDTWTKLNTSTDSEARNNCKLEYDVQPCSAAGLPEGGCIDSKRTSFILPTGGDFIYGVAHQHSGGAGSALYGEDGRVICSSMPTYGVGEEPGNEAGYIVGMSTCYPQPGSVKISDGETLVLESNYSSTQKHTGVMGLFYILVAESARTSSMPNVLFGSQDQVHKVRNGHYSIWPVALFGVVIAIIAVVVHSQRRVAEEDGYQPIVM